MRLLRRSPAAARLAALAALLATACSSSDANDAPDAAPASDAAPLDASNPVHDASVGDAARPGHALTVDVAFTADSSGQIQLDPVQGKQSAPADPVKGKMAYAIVYPEGDQPGNGTPLASGGNVMGQDLTSTITLPPVLADGYYELALVVAVSGWAPKSKASPGAEDIVAFTDATTAPAPADGVPYTGQTVRFRVQGANATVKIDGGACITFGSSHRPPKDAGADTGAHDAGGD